MAGGPPIPGAPIGAPEPAKKSSKGLIIALVLVLLAIAVVVALLLLK
jgi:hypothetical protein